MNEKYTDLRHKTLLDFNPSEEALDEILCGHTQADIDIFLGAIADKTPYGCGNFEDTPSGEVERMLSFMSFIDFIQDKDLIEAIEREFGKEYELLHNE
ncbi:MAG: hypothetical protein IJT48_01575 [Bacteroidaceae bacterium]|nr:hypothetical protein [Bacteroidaceae bacterium]